MDPTSAIAPLDRRDAPTRPRSTTPRFEHDACGVGFVADAGGRSRARVLPLALAGLAALAHRGAFGADGESSDGAGVALPLDPSRARVPDRRRSRRPPPDPGVVMAFLPRGRTAERAARSARRARRSPRAACRSCAGGPCRSRPCALGASAAASRPTVAQAIVARPTRSADDPRPLGDDAFERRLVVARRRIETAARAAGGAVAELSIPSASCRTIVYKGLVAGGRLAELYPDLRAPVEVGYAVFHQRYATNTHPVWRLAQPFRSIAHNGEINTVRGNREQVRGRARDLGARPIAAELRDAGPLLSPDGSDSLSLDEGLELLTTTGWELTPALLAAIPEALGLRRAPHPHVATLRRRTAGMLAPWDGPAAIVFADGRPVGALIDRNGLRPAAFAITRDRLVAVASEAGAVPFAAADTIRRGRLGPGRAAARRARTGARSSRTPRPRPGPSGRCPSTTSRGRSTRTRRRPPPRRIEHADAARPRRAAISPALDAERARLDIKTMALEAHEPLWSMGDDTPTAGSRPRSTGRSPTTCARRSPRSPTRPSTRSASASSWTCGSSSAAGRRCSAVRRAARARSASSARSWPTSTACWPRFDERGDAGPDPRRHVVGRPPVRPGSKRPSAASRPRRSPPPSPASRSSS